MQLGFVLKTLPGKLSFKVHLTPKFLIWFDLFNPWFIVGYPGEATVGTTGFSQAKDWVSEEAAESVSTEIAPACWKTSFPFGFKTIVCRFQYKIKQLGNTAVLSVSSARYRLYIKA